MRPIRVFIVDDSAVVRQTMAEVIGAQSDMEVLGSASDPIFALRKMEKDWPDVITLDVEMPRQDGLSFLREIMRTRPTPTIMCSSITTEGAAATVDAYRYGATRVIAKPTLGVKKFLEEYSKELADAIREAASTNLKRMTAYIQEPDKVKEEAPPPPAPKGRAAERIVVMGASAGGAIALEYVFRRLKSDSPGVAVVQHMPEKFTGAFSERLNTICEVEVREARDGDAMHRGLVLIAPGDKHMRVVRLGPHYKVRVIDGPRVNHHRPAVDVLFNSIAEQGGGRHILGVILTGMGNDGAAGMLAMHEKGVETIAQDEASCAVYGMPREAVKRGGVDRELPLDAMHEAIMKHAFKSA